MDDYVYNRAPDWSELPHFLIVTLWSDLLVKRLYL